MKYGLQTGFLGEPSGADALAEVASRRFGLVRIDVRPCIDAAHAARLRLEALDAGLETLCIVDRRTAAWVGGDVCVGNEPDGQVSVADYALEVDDVLALRASLGGTVWVGETSNLHQRGQAFWAELAGHLTGLLSAAAVAGVRVGASTHRYPVRDDFATPQDRGRFWFWTLRYASRDVELQDWLRRLPPGLPWMVTEFGYHDDRCGAAHAAQEIAKEWAFWRDAGAEAAVLFQLNDGRDRPGFVDKENHFGLRHLDGSWKPAADTVPADAVPPAPPRLPVVAMFWERPGLPARPATATLRLDDGLPPFAGEPLPTGQWRFLLPPAGHYGHQGHFSVDGGPEVNVVLAADLPAVEMPPRRRARPGEVRIVGRGLLDADGRFLGAGTSLFWGPWAVAHDRPRLDRALAFLDGRLGLVRAFGCVGPAGRWEDRTLTPGEALTAVPAFVDVAYEAGQRTFLTMLAGLDHLPKASDREEFVRRLAHAVADRRHKLGLVEVANEGWQNGFPGQEGEAELRRLAGIVRAILPDVPLALTDPLGYGGDDPVERLYRGSAATLVTAHLERDVSGTGGLYRPIRQARELVGSTWGSTEPIGIQSSVAADADPTRLALAAVYTWLCNGAVYILHTGAGTRGGGLADLERGRAGHLDEQPTMDAAVDGIEALRAALPADLQDWAWSNNNPGFPAYPFDTDPLVDEGNALRSFIAISGPQFVCVPLHVQRTTPYTARRPMTFDVLSVDAAAGTAGRVLDRVSLDAGQAYDLTPRPGAVFRGRFL